MFDTIIVGAGPAGLSAAVYAKRAGLDAIMIDESPADGGQVLQTYEVDNYLGIPDVTGGELSEKFSEHAQKAGILRLTASVTGLEVKEESFTVNTDEGDWDAKSVVWATGSRHAMLKVPGEDELAGMGVSYCATCDGAFFKGKTVCVVGGSDVAVEDAIYLSNICKQVYLIHRRDKLRAANSLVELLATHDNVSIIWNTVVRKINGEDEVTGVEIFNNVSNETTELQTDGVFVAVGTNAVSELLAGIVETDAAGYVIAGEDCRTSQKGLYVAGDIRKKPIRQIITAVADGANAIASIQNDIA